MKKIRFLKPYTVLPRRYAPDDDGVFDAEIANRAIDSGAAVFVEEVELPPPKAVDPDGPMVVVRAIGPSSQKSANGEPATRLIDGQHVMGGEVATITEREAAAKYLAGEIELADGQTWSMQALQFLNAVRDHQISGARSGKMYPKFQDFP